MGEPLSRPPLISVIIPTYRRAHELDRCIKSVLAEPGDLFDVLVGDDASPDATPEVIRSHRDDPRLHSYRNEANLGLRRNMLEVARRARGTYLFILTDDDYMVPGALAKVVQIVRAHPEVGYCLSHLTSVDERTGLVQHVHRTFPVDTLLEPGIPSVTAVAGSAWVLSRQILKRDLVDWDAWDRFADNIFFPIIVAGRLLLRAPFYYLAENLVTHTFFNRVYWDAFGRDELEIQYNLAADRYRCMRDIFFDQARTPEVESAIHNWEALSFKSYLYLSHGGYWDLAKAIGFRAAREKLRGTYALKGRERIEYSLFPLKIPFARVWIGLKRILRRLPTSAVASVRKRRLGLRA